MRGKMKRNIVPVMLSTLIVLVRIQTPSAVHLTKEDLVKLASGHSFEKPSHHIEKRQAIVNPQAYTPLIPPQSAPNSLNTPFTTTIGFFPNIAGKSHTDKCPRDKIEMVDGTCQYLMTQGSCKKSEEVILDFDTGKGFCAERLCAPDRIFLHSTQLCHDPRDVTVCPVGREIFYSSYGTSVCACPDGTIETDDDLDDDVCEEILKPTLTCSQNMPNTVRWLRNFNSMPECLPDPCGGANLNTALLRDSLPFLPSDAGQCYRWGESEGAACPSKTYFALALEKVKGECSELEEAGYEIFDTDSINFFATEYGPLIAQKGGAPIPPSPGNANQIEGLQGNSSFIANPDSNVIGGNLSAQGLEDDLIRGSGMPLEGPFPSLPINAFHIPKASGVGHVHMRGVSPPDKKVLSVNLEISKNGQEFKVERVTQNGVVDGGNFRSQHTRPVSSNSFGNSLPNQRPSPNFQFAQGFDANRASQNGRPNSFNNANNLGILNTRIGSNGHSGQSPHVSQQMDFTSGFNRNGAQSTSVQQPVSTGNFFPSRGSRPNSQFSQSIGFGNQNQDHSRFSPGQSHFNKSPNSQGFQQNHGSQSHQGHDSQGFKSSQGFQSHQGHDSQRFQSNHGAHQQGVQQNRGSQSHQGQHSQGFQSNQGSNMQGFQQDQGFQSHGGHHSLGFQQNHGSQSHQGHHSHGFQSNEGPQQQGFLQNQGFQSHQGHHSPGFQSNQGFQSYHGSHFQGFQSDNQFNSPEIFDPNSPVSLEVFNYQNQQSHQSRTQASFNSVEYREPYGMRVGRSLRVNPPVQATLNTYVTILPSGEKIVHKIPHPRRIRSIPDDAEGIEGESYFKRFFSSLPENADDSKILSRKRRSSLPYASPSNVFETRLLGCRPGALRDINAKCRNTILPPRVPKRRGIRASPPSPPSPSCPRNFARDIRRQCVPRTTARRSILANNLG